MKLSPKMTLLILYVFLFIMFLSQVLAQMPINEATIPYIVLSLGLFVVGLLLILAWDYIIPSIFRKYRLGKCIVEDKKFIICRYKNSPELTGYVFVKIVPTHPIADMPKERKESILQTIQSLLAGAQFEVTIAYVAMKDRYHQNIIKRLKEEKERIRTFAHRETLAIKDTLQRIDTELRILEQVPVILEGFYIAIIREYGTDIEELKQKLEADSRAVIGKLSALGTETKVIEGEELRNIASYLLFGSVVQLAF